MITAGDLLWWVGVRRVDAGSEFELGRVEQELGVRFPEDYRAHVIGEDKVKGFFPPAGDFLELFAIGDVVGVNAAGAIQARFPGVVVVGGDGAREFLAYDLREPAPPLFLLENCANDWSEAIFQAGSLTEFLQAFPARGWRWEPEGS